MAWPVSRSTGFLVTSTAWNEIVSAFATWGGNVAAGGYSLSNLGTLDAGGIFGNYYYVGYNNGSPTAAGGYIAAVSKSGTNAVGVDLEISGGNGTGSGGSGSIKFAVAAPGVSGSTYNTFSTAMTIVSSGNVGIGTTSPAGKLEIRTDASDALVINKVSANQSPSYIRAGADMSNLRLQAGTTAGFYSAVEVMGWNGTGDPPKVGVYTSGAERLRIDSSGNVGIGTTSPSYKLDVTGDVRINGASNFLGTVYNIVGGARFFAGSGGLTYLYTNTSGMAWRNQADTSQIALLTDAGAFNAVGAITQNGNQVLHAGNYTSYSPSLTGTGATGTWGINITGSAGSVSLAVASKTSAYSILTTDSVILCNATTAAFTVTLPTAVGNTGKTFYIKKTDSSANAITIATTSSQTVDGATTKTITSQYTTLQLVSDGANWQIL